jgi:hypothetical protein
MDSSIAFVEAFRFASATPPAAEPVALDLRRVFLLFHCVCSSASCYACHHSGFSRSSSLDLLTWMLVALVRKMAGIGLRIKPRKKMVNK